MRILEILIPILLAPYLFWPVTGKARPRIINSLPIFAIFGILLHLIVEGYRWQMIPLYLLAAASALSGTVAITRCHNFRPRWGAITASLGTIILLAVSTAIPILLPVPSVDEPTGPYKVGTRSYELVDTDRLELYSENPEEPRRFMIQVWYPANPSPDAQHAPWMENAEIFAPAIAEYLHLPGFFLDHLTLSKSPAFTDVPLAPTTDGYPVILFSHGWNGFASQNSGQAIELASHGYIVVGLQHTYGARVTVFPEGTVAMNNPNAMPSNTPEEEYDPLARKLVAQWAGDIAYALDIMETNNLKPESIFYQALDLERVGVYGHSTGGGATIQFCGTDPRCKVAVGLDPYMVPVSEAVLDSGIPQPLFVMFSETFPSEKNTRLFEQLYSHQPARDRVVTIMGTAHYDFSDLPLLSPITPQLGLKGPINGNRAVMIVNTYLLAFFDLTIKNQPSTLFDGPSAEFPEVIFNH